MYFYINDKALFVYCYIFSTTWILRIPSCYYYSSKIFCVSCLFIRL